MAEERRSVGRYQVRRVLGRGAMGVVYEGHDPDLGRRVAIKSIDLAFSTSDDERLSFVERFLTEARAAACLSHPCIVVVYDIGRDERGLPFMTLEYLEGETLESMLAQGQPLEWKTAVDIARQLGDALHQAHRNQIIHRDVKPANVMVLPSGYPKLMDFGIAKVASAQLTISGQVFGSPSYMSPEQIRGDTLDARCDLFALGAVLYEMLTGRRAFPGSSPPEILKAVMQLDPAPPSSLRPGLPPEVDALLRGLLAKARDHRCPDGATFARDAAAVLRGEAPSFQGPPVDATRQGGYGGQALPRGKRVSLAAIAGPCQGQTFPVDKPRVTLGRTGPGASAYIQIPDPEISRTHAALTCDGERFELQDLKSTNGTLVDGKPIEACTLPEGGEFIVGGTKLMLIVTEAE